MAKGFSHTTVFPARTAEWFSWTIDVPMTAVFLGAAYWSSAVLEVAGARSRTWGRARVTVWTVLVFTVLPLVVTLVHLDKFHLGPEHPATARAVAWGWLAIYAGVPLAMVVGLVLQARAGGAPTGADVVRPLPSGLRWLLVGLAALLLASGVALLLAPEWAAEAFSDIDEDVRQSIARIKASPFIPHKDAVRGFVYEVETGRLREVAL